LLSVGLELEKPPHVASRGERLSERKGRWPILAVLAKGSREEKELEFKRRRGEVFYLPFM
jgi:hypothetical protein